MSKIILFASACFLALPASAVPASLGAKKSGTLDKSCEALGKVMVCFNSQRATDGLLMRVAGKRARVLFKGPDGEAPYEIEQRKGGYRVKVGAPSRSDVPFFAYTEVVFRQVGSSFRVERYVVATDAECEGSPDIRMLYEFDLQKRTQTAILAPPWSSDGRVHRFVSPVKLPSNDLFRLSAWDFINRLRPAAAVQRLCSA